MGKIRDFFSPKAVDAREGVVTYVDFDTVIAAKAWGVGVTELWDTIASWPLPSTREQLYQQYEDAANLIKSQKEAK